METNFEQHIYKNRYEVTGSIASGGMAQVFRATDLTLMRPVALKVLHPELSIDSNFVERFRREAQAAANLSHSNIVPVFDWGEENGSYFIVMELVEGASLAGLLNGEPTISQSRAASISSQVAAALAIAHRSGVVHRDIKPGNILITVDGVVKVTDFGIAQAMSTEDHLATAGSVMGTATYFSPEQASGSLVDGRSDIYSLGVVLYELLAGRPPFVGGSPGEVAAMHVRDSAPSLLEFNAEIHADLQAITMMALAKNPAQRYQTADEMRSDLLRFSEGRPVQAAQRAGRAFVGSDATQAVNVVSGERTQAVPIQAGPRTDVVRRRKSNAPFVALTTAFLMCIIGALGFFFVGSSATKVMPDVIGNSVIDATSTITAQGLIVGGSKLVESELPAGSVVSTIPKPGAKVRKGQSVTLRVSLGVSTQPVTIPDVTGMSISAAARELQTLGLSYTVNFLSSLPVGLDPTSVLSQDPPGGTSARTGDKVTISYLSPDAMIPVPGIRNISPAAAADILRKFGMTLASTQSDVCSNTVPQGSVVSSTPSEGSAVAPGAVVSVAISSGYCNMVAPNVIGFSRLSAESAMRKQGFVVIVETLSPEDALCLPYPGEVIDQDLAAGATAQFNSVVTLTYCPPS